MILHGKRIVIPLLILVDIVIAQEVVPHPVKVITASFLGDKGTEWCTCGAFCRDNTIIIGGVTLSADISLLGVKAQVIGKDAEPIEEQKEFVKLGVKDTGKIELPQLQKEEKDLLTDSGRIDFSLEEKPDPKKLKEMEEEKRKRLTSVPERFQFYIHKSIQEKDAYVRLYGGEPSATGFIGKFTPGLDKVLSLYRLPRGAGSITAVAVGKEGEVYIAGIAKERITLFCENNSEDVIPYFEKPSDNSFPAGHVFIARLSEDLSKVVWLRHIRAWSYAPRLFMLNNGNIAMLGPGYVQYDSHGKLLVSTYIPKSRVLSGSSVDPSSGRYTRVGDWMSPTGREPYRCPRLIVHNPDGTTYKWLLGWRGPFFAPKHFHLVADSAVRRSAFDSEGNLIYSTWSHGGNNCCGRLPYDPETPIRDPMGYTGSKTYCYIIKLDKEQNFVTGILWTSAGAVYALTFACDGSIVWVGDSSASLNVKGALAPPKTGKYLVIAEPNLSHYRFCSSMPAVGTRVAVGGCSDMIFEWGFATGVCEGKPMLLCLSGAVQEEKLPEGNTVNPPLMNPMQAEYAGGLMDGYLVLFDLTSKELLPFGLPPPEPVVKKEQKEESSSTTNLLWPAEGQVWKIGTEKCITVKVTFRDLENKYWPSFFQGKGVMGGMFVFGTDKAKADFILDCPTILQEVGLQYQRILGELVNVEERIITGKVEIVNAKTPKLKIHVTGSTPWKKTTKTENFGRFPVGECFISGIMYLDSKKIPFTNVLCKATFEYPYRDTITTYLLPNAAVLSASFVIKGAELGLSPPRSELSIKVSFAWEAVSDVKVVKKEEYIPPKLDVEEDNQNL